MPELFENHTPGLDSPASRAFAIEPNETAFLPNITRALYVGVQGDIQLRALGGQTFTLANVPAETIFTIRYSNKLATETKASALVGLF